MESSSAQRNMPPPAEDVWRRCIRQLLLRAPCLLPFLSVAGAAWGGQGWVLPIASFACSYLMGMKRLMLMCLFCSLLVFLRTSRLEALNEDFVKQAQVNGYAVAEGTVVRTLARGCVVDGAPDKPSVLLRGELPFRCGDRVRVVGSMRERQEALYPGMFDAARWLRGQGIAAELDYIRGECLGRPFSWAVLKDYASVCRARCERNLMPPGTEGDRRRQFLCALVLGDKQYADPDMIQDFQRGGCLHIFAVSGLHVGLVAGILWLLARVLRMKPAYVRPLILLLSGVYVLLTGMALSALRAYLMLAVLLVGSMLRRQVNLLNVWCFAGWALLLVEPWQVDQSSFLLSFTVYGAIGLGVRLCLKDRPWFGPDAYIPFRIMTQGEKRMQSVESWVRGTVMVSVIAWIASLPLMIGLFHAVNLYGIFTNVVIAPMLPLVMGAGLLCLCLAPVPWVGALVCQAAVRGAACILSVVTFFADLPHAYLPVESPRADDECVLVSLGYGNSACMLGNNGLLIDCGSEKAARFTLQPLLFHMGFSPAALLKTRPTSSRCGGEDVLRVMRPGIKCLPCGLTGASVSLHTSAGDFRIYYPPADLPKSPTANSAPLVTWHHRQGLLVYVGDASLSTLERVTEDISSASVLILGYNPSQMADADTLRERMPAARIILLPSAVQANVTAEQFAPTEVTVAEDNTSYLLFRCESPNAVIPHLPPEDRGTAEH